MAVFRVEKTKDYTVMSNHHLRNTALSLKAKGMLSLMLSLPDSWDYTTKGLSYICKDGIDSITAGIKELEANGYVTRRRIRNDKGQLTEIEYTIHESPVLPVKSETLDTTVSEPKRENPRLDNPRLENPEQASPVLGNPDQLNTYRSNTEKSNTDLSSIHQSIQQPGEDFPQDLSTRKYLMDSIDGYRELLYENISYEVLCSRYGTERVDETVELLLEIVCTNRKYIKIAGNEFPAEVVKSRFLKLNSSHIEYAFDCLDKNTTKVHNIKGYLLTTLYNTFTSIDSYYRAEVNHDLYGSGST